MPAPTVIAAHIIPEVLKAGGFKVEQYFLADATYVALDDNAVSDYFFKLSAQSCAQFGTWQEEKWDCDKFSRVVQAAAMMSHAVQYRGEPAALGVATVAYIENSGTGHAINGVLTKLPGKTLLRFRTFEPQTGMEVHLSVTEKAQVKYILL